MITDASPSVYLASRSPRRRELLEQIGVRYTPLLEDDGSAPEVDESPQPGEAPQAYVERVARAKAQAGWARVLARGLARAPVLAADTAVVLGTRILGKPADREAAAAMLAALSQREHAVLTAVVVQHESRVEQAVSHSTVRFRGLDAAEIRAYLASGEADDKAGAYAIQGRAAQFVSALSGSYSGVVGLPLYETAQLIGRFAR